MKKALVESILEKCNDEDGVILVLDSIKSCGGYSSAQVNIEVEKQDIKLFDDYFSVDTHGDIFNICSISGVMYAEYEFIKAIMIGNDY